MRADDVPAVMAVQEPASIAGLSGVFPQDAFPFPREVLADRWRAEIVAHMARAGVRRAWLCVYTANPRGRAFWPRLAWTDTGERSRGPMPPHAEQLILHRPL